MLKREKSGNITHQYDLGDSRLSFLRRYCNRIQLITRMDNKLLLTF